MIRCCTKGSNSLSSLNFSILHVKKFELISSSIPLTRKNKLLLNYKIINCFFPLIMNEFQRCFLIFWKKKIILLNASGVSASLGTTIYAILQVVITGLNTIVIDKAGRKPLLLVAATGLIIGCLLTGTSFYLKDHGLALNSVPAFAIAGILVYISAFSAGMGAVPWVIMSEIFPINIKGVGGSLVTLVNWIGAWTVSFTFNFLSNWSSYGTFILYAVVNALAIVFVIMVVPETKGRTLEQIQAAMNTKRNNKT